VTVTQSATANGTLSSPGGGSYNATTGVYTDTNTVTAVTAALDGLVFTPTAHQVAQGGTVTTTFTITDIDTAGARATANSITTVIATAGTVAPTISGTVAGQTTGDLTPISPFSKVTVADQNFGQTETVTVTQSATANGTLSSPGGGSYNATTGVYTDTNTVTAVTAALDGLVFTPHRPSGCARRDRHHHLHHHGHRHGGGQRERQQHHHRDRHRRHRCANDQRHVAGQTTGDLTPISPFSKVTVADQNFGQTETVTVTQSATANGTLSSPGGGSYNATTGVYTDTNTVTAVTAALDGLVFTPTKREVSPGQTVTTGFTVKDTDTAGASASDAPQPSSSRHCPRQRSRAMA